MGNIKRKRAQKLTYVLLTRGKEVKDNEKGAHEEIPVQDRLTENQIKLMLKHMEIVADEMDPSLPPGYTPNNGWFGKQGTILDLAYRALLIKRARDINEHEYQF